MLASDAISASVGSLGNIEEPKHESLGAPLAALSGAEAAAALDACESRRTFEFEYMRGSNVKL